VVPVVFEYWGAVLAGAVVALPMLYVPARAAFAAIDRDLLDAAVVMGASRGGLFWSVGIPLARRGLAAGLVLALARALGEFGATVMVLGLQPGKQTLSIAVYAAWAGGDLAAAVPFVAALVVCSVGLLMAYHAVVRERS
jgi:molybdate transport system permease protein